MKKFILKTSLFVVPFLALHMINVLFYKKNDGDLTRVGYMYHNPSPTKNITNQFSLEEKFMALTNLSLENDTSFDVLTIGDSFSEQKKLGYKNQLAHQDISLLHVNRHLAGDNPIQTLVSLANGDFFDRVKVKYVVLQSSERLVIQRCERINFEKILSVDSIKKLAQKEHLQTPEPKVEFFSDALFIIPFTNIQYLFTSKPTHSKTYKVKSESRNLFSNQPADILFFQGDIHALQIKNDSLKCWSTNATLHAINNLLHQKNIKLIMLISPDKYDVYYDFIQQKETYEAPMFFTYFDALPKEYMYVSAMKKLSEAAAKQPDIYLYDDTHWSPIGAKIIADEIAGLIKPAQPEYGNF